MADKFSVVVVVVVIVLLINHAPMRFMMVPILMMITAGGRGLMLVEAYEGRWGYGGERRAAQKKMPVIVHILCSRFNTLYFLLYKTICLFDLIKTFTVFYFGSVFSFIEYFLEKREGGWGVGEKKTGRS